MSKVLSDNVLVLASRVYSAGIGIALLPYFLEVLGKEQYGLVGSFVILQACMQILDAGVSGVLTRQSILTQKNQESFLKFIGLLKQCLLIFALIAFIVVCLGHGFAIKYSAEWFNTDLEESVISTSVSLMFVIFSLKYIQGPIKSILVSYEKHKLLSLLEMAYISLSNPVVLFYLYTLDGDITDFFKMQLIASLLSLILICMFAWVETEKTKRSLKLAKDSSEIVDTCVIDLIRFGLKLSLLSMLWVIVNQSDKVTLTKYMDLSEYSFYSISISMLGLITVFVSTMTQTVRPRLIMLFSGQEWDKFTELFKISVISLTSLLVPLIVFLSYYGEDVLYLWTDNQELSVKVMVYLPYLLVGSFFVSMSEFSFMILYSTGRLKAHTIFYSFVSFFVVPLNIYVASNYLGQGSSKLFMLINLLLFITWSLYNIRKYLRKTGRLFFSSFLLTFLLSLTLINISTLFVKVSDFLSLSVVIFLGGTTVVLSYILLSKLFKFTHIEFRKGSLS